MKSRLLPTVFLSVAFFLSFYFSPAQTNHAFAITGENKGNLNWMVIREIDLSSGELIRDLYVPSPHQSLLYDALTGRPLATPVNTVISTNPVSKAMPNLMAAAALDGKNNRLYFTPLNSLELRYIDLNSPGKLFVVTHQLLRSFVVNPGEEDNITRMAFGSDGYGYALTNNSHHLIRFSSGKKIEITDLGSLKNGIKNGDQSIYEQANWGGDIVGDAFGNLLLFTVKGNVFKINPQTKVADYLGSIKDLPQGFTVNAAAVDADGFVVVSSSLFTTNYFKIDLATLKAAAISKKDDNVFNASDFANANCAYDKEVPNLPASIIENDNGRISIFPNPVANKSFTILFNQTKPGAHTMELFNAKGQKLLSRDLYVSGKQTEQVGLPKTVSSGIYLLKISNKQKVVFYQKLVVEN